MYRDDLHAAHKRIEELEAIVAGRPARRSRRAAWAVVPLLVISVMGACGAVFVVRGRRSTAAEAAAVAPVAVAPTFYVHDYRDNLTSPFTPDVDEDGVEDVVFLARDQARPNGPVYVQAVSGKSFAALWTAGPFEDAEPSNVAVTGHSVVVTTRGETRILDLHSGGETHSLPLTGHPSVCPVRGEPQHAVLAADVLLDVETGTTSPVYPAPGAVPRADPVACDYPGTLCSIAADRPCFGDHAVSARDAKVHGWTTLVDGRTRVSYGWVLVPSLARDHMYAAGGTPDEHAASKDAIVAGKTLWEHDATLEGEPIVELEHVTNYQSMMADLHGDRFVLAYGTAKGVRLVGRSAATGALTWNTLLPGRPTDAALRGTTSRIYLLTDWKITVLESSSGAVLGTIGS